MVIKRRARTRTHRHPALAVADKPVYPNIQLVFCGSPKIEHRVRGTCLARDYAKRSSCLMSVDTNGIVVLELGRCPYTYIDNAPPRRTRARFQGRYDLLLRDGADARTRYESTRVQRPPTI
ncbi:hypothetical protein EVAR_62374_1 [Eumeta japonica]|uniref:Uncharacterized protein n=1 Tax=Eumeta variegata TaxID=151549 RepID=A0A4C1Z1C5_EUMVA|nr:hypothetical protein EVAR_62374_1 [Eumeta japonica]